MHLPTITIQTVLSRQGLLDLRDSIDVLIADTSADTTNLAAKVVDSNADRKVSEVWERVGANAQRFLTTAAHKTAPGQEFTMSDVATWLDKEPRTIRSWHRNLGRTLKQSMPRFPSRRSSRVGGPDTRTPTASQSTCEKPSSAAATL